MDTNTPQLTSDGFDTYAGGRWIYPNNMPVRSYQKVAVEKALFNNALIVLPTGFGKTFIAAVVMYNFYRWYPTGKVIFVAPTRPLVAQQIQECKKISGIPPSDCIELTGLIPRNKREALWQTKRVFFATPQVIENDLNDGETLPVEDIKCIVIDEAHRAQGSYAYVNIVRNMNERNPNKFRILALSATPGPDIERVQQLMINLYISDVMFRTEDSIDLMNFKNSKMSKAWTVELKGQHQEFVREFVKMADPYVKELYRAGLTYSCDSIERVSKFVLLKAGEQLSRNEANFHGKSTKGRLSYVRSVCISLAHQFELLTIYGIRVFYSSVTNTLKDSKNRLGSALVSKLEFDRIMDGIKVMFGPDVEPDPDKKSEIDLTKGHPKLQVAKDLLMRHFGNITEKETRAIVFTKYRESVFDIVQTLKAYEPVLKPVAFVGQGAGKKVGSGMKQSAQIQTVKDFKNGIYNVLVATCVAEEGLDIGEVDLIICFDTTSSPISNVQRRGRTGRKRSGDVQTLLTKGYEEKKLQKAGASRRNVEEQLYKRDNYMSHRYRNAPRMVPADVHPVCLEQKIFPIVEEEEVKPQRKRTSGKARRRSSPECESVKKKRKKKVFEEDEEENTDMDEKHNNKHALSGTDSEEDWNSSIHKAKSQSTSSEVEEVQIVGGGGKFGDTQNVDELDGVNWEEGDSGQLKAGELAPADDDGIEWDSDIDYNCV